MIEILSAVLGSLPHSYLSCRFDVGAGTHRSGVRANLLDHMAPSFSVSER